MLLCPFGKLYRFGTILDGLNEFDRAHSLLRHLPEVILNETGFQNQSSAHHFDGTARHVAVTLARKYRQRFDPCWIMRASRHVEFSERDHRSDPTVQVMFNPADNIQPWCVVANGRMSVAIDQTGNQGHPDCIDYLRCSFDLGVA